MKTETVVGAIVRAVVYAAGFVAVNGCDSGVAWNYEIVDGEAYVGNHLQPTNAVPMSTKGEMAIPKRLGGHPVTVIARNAFKGCDSLTVVSIPQGVTRIEEGAFWDCTRLVSVTIPNTVTNIGKGAFMGCVALSNVSMPDKVAEIDDWTFHCCSNLTKVTIGSGVKRIGAHAFNQSGITRMTIPDGVTSIGASAFWSCGSLTEVTIPDSVRNIGVAAFQFCDKLDKVVVPFGTKMDPSAKPEHTIIHNETAVERFERLRKAAEQGDARTQARLGYCYKDGIGVGTNYAEAVRWFRKAAEQGEPWAQAGLGLCFLDGLGVDTNQTEAAKLFQKAAEQNNIMSQRLLGFCCVNGWGMEKNQPEAVKWLHKAAMQNDIVSQRALGCLYFYGTGVAEDKSEGVKWIRQAAGQGEVVAQYLMGSFCEIGDAVEKDPSEAFRWMTKAAEQGYAEAQYKVGYYYFLGDGVERDVDIAKRWWLKATKQGHKGAIEVYRRAKDLGSPISFMGFEFGENVEKISRVHNASYEKDGNQIKALIETPKFRLFTSPVTIIGGGKLSKLYEIRRFQLFPDSMSQAEREKEYQATTSVISGKFHAAGRFEYPDETTSSITFECGDVSITVRKSSNSMEIVVVHNKYKKSVDEELQCVTSAKDEDGADSL